jgi:hypothetical protein
MVASQRHKGRPRARVGEIRNILCYRVTQIGNWYGACSAGASWALEVFSAAPGDDEHFLFQPIWKGSTPRALVIVDPPIYYRL